MAKGPNARDKLREFAPKLIELTEGVLIETTDGESSWVTVGVGHNVIEASWEALVDGVTFGLRRQGEHPQ